MQLELDKIVNTTLYLAEKVPDLYFTKYLKLVYYFDFISVLERGVPVTRDTYYHLPLGPIPSFIKNQINLLDKQAQNAEKEIYGKFASTGSIFNDVIALAREKSNNGLKIKPKNGKKANLDCLSQYEKELLDDIIGEFSSFTVKKIVDKTHEETPYKQTAANNIIDYRLAFYLDISKILPKRNYESNKELSQMEYFSAA